jgi:Iap family predicted aminopeptidase
MVKKICLLVCFLIPVLSFAKSDKDKIDQSPVAKIKRDIDYLTSDRMEGRLTGSNGELHAAEYIESRFKTMNIAPYKSKYKWEFTTKGGMKVGANAYFKIFEQSLKIGSEVIVMPYGNGNSILGFTMPKVYEPDNVWMISMKELKVNESNNPQKVMYEYAQSCIEKGAQSIVYYNDIDVFQDISQLNLLSFQPLSKPVTVINNKAYQYYIKPNLKKDWIVVDAKLGFEESNATGKNVVGMIDNKAPFTVVIGAHYDYIGNLGAEYKGADDNASGVAALLALAEMVKSAGIKNYNYMFIAFSGKEQNLQGSKSFLKQNEYFTPTISCMIDIDMVGRLKPTARELYISGYGTSPKWSSMLTMMNKGFNLKIDSSGYGYSDYTSFYNKNIPVLRFSTGYHEDYMQPSDKADKINTSGEYDIISYIYRVVTEIDRNTKPVFNKTNDILPKLENQKSDIGIIPDFSFADNGIRIAACIPNKTASKSGMNSGDVITKIGPFTIIDFDDYIEAMRKTDQGREVTVVVKRGKNEYKFFVVL